MPTYRYRALNERNVAIVGEYEGANLEEIARRLLAEGHTPLSIDAPPRFAVAFSGDPRRGTGRSPSNVDLAFFFERLSDLVNAGVRPDRALTILSRSVKETTLKRSIREVSAKVSRGGALAPSLAAEIKGMPAYAAGLIAAGEASGALPVVLRRLAQSQRRAADLRSKFTSALIYPTLLLVMILGTMLLVFGVVLPEFERVFASARAPLPPITRALLDVSAFVAAWWPLLVAAAATAVAALIYALRHPALRERLDGWRLRLPLVRAFEKSSAAGQFFRVMGLMTEGGFTLTESLELASGALRNRHLSRQFEQAGVQLREGVLLSEALKDISAISSETLDLMSVGEETGKLGPILNRIAEQADKDFEVLTERSLTLLTPVLTIVMGLLVAIVVLSLISGIMSLNQLA